MELAKKGLGGIRIARVLSKTYSLKVCPGTINHWIYGDRKPRLRNIFKELPSPALSYIIGANEGNGCTLTSSGWAKLEVTDKDFAETFNSKMVELFSRDKPNRILVRRFNTERLSLYTAKYSSQQLVKLLRWPLEGLLKLASAFPRDFLRGFFDAEGFVEVAAEDAFEVRVGAENSNRSLLSGARRTLQRAFHINSTMRLKRKSGTPKTIRGTSFVTRRTSFRLLICRLDDVKKFGNQIGFSIHRKQEKLEDAQRILKVRGKRNRSAACREIYLRQNREWMKR